MKQISFPPGYRLEPLQRAHRRKRFRSGDELVDDWLATKALQHQEKHLSSTKVLLNESDLIIGYYTLAPNQLDFGDLPPEDVRKLPHRMLPVAVLAWFGIEAAHQGQQLGTRLLAQALHDCWSAGQTFPFVAVILDCLNPAAKRFYQKHDFSELPGQPYRLFLSAQQLNEMMRQS